MYGLFEWVPNDLSGVLKEAEARGGLARRTGLQLLLQTLRCLHAMHDAGYVHRDLKPSNVLLSCDGVIKLCDFGFVNCINDTAKTLTVCTPSHRPPECFFRTRDHTAAIDVWSWACLAFRVLTKQGPTPGRNDLEVLQSIFLILGAPTRDQWPELFDEPGLCPHFPEAQQQALAALQLQGKHRAEPRLPKMLAGIRDEACERMLALCLQWRPGSRPSCAELIADPAFFAERVCGQDEVVVGDEMETQSGEPVKIGALHVYLLRNPGKKLERKRVLPDG